MDERRAGGRWAPRVAEVMALLLKISCAGDLTGMGITFREGLFAE